LPGCPVKRVEKSAIAATPPGTGVRQPEECTVRKCDSFLNEPAISAHIDNIAGRKGRFGIVRHAGVSGNARAEQERCRQAPLGMKNCDSSPKVRLRGVEKLGDERMALERLLNDAALHAFAAAVNQPNLA